MPPLHPLPDLPGVYYSRVVGTWEGLPCTNIFTFQADTAPAPGTGDVLLATTIASAIATRWPAFASPTFVDRYTADEVQTYPLHTPLAPFVVAPMAAVGTLAGASAPVNVAVAVSHAVTRRGRGSQSRTYLGAIEGVAITADGKTLTNAAQGIIQTAFTSFIAGVKSDVLAATGVNLAYVQLSKGPPGRTFVITASTCEFPVSTQRRRQRR